MAIVARDPIDAATIEQVVVGGDLSKLTSAQRVSYYQAVCSSLGLNPLTRPFDYITLNGRLTLYAKRDATDQLRRLHGISITELTERQAGDIYIVKASAKEQSELGRTDAAIGAVSIANLKGEFLANAMMKAETKAKRRVTLSLAGLGWLDETETSSIPEAVPVVVNPETGEVAPESGESTSQLGESREVAAARLAAAQTRVGLTNAALVKLAHDMYGVKMLKDLSDAQMSQLADEVDAKVEEEVPHA